MTYLNSTTSVTNSAQNAVRLPTHRTFAMGYFVLRSLTLCRDNAPCLVKKENVSPGQGNKAGEAHWNGQVTAREVAKKAKAHQLQVSDTVVRVSLLRKAKQKKTSRGFPRIQT